MYRGLDLGTGKVTEEEMELSLNVGLDAGAEAKRITCMPVSMGNPHAVVFLDEAVTGMLSDWKKEEKTIERRSGAETAPAWISGSGSVRSSL